MYDSDVTKSFVIGVSRLGRISCDYQDKMAETSLEKTKSLELSKYRWNHLLCTLTSKTNINVYLNELSVVNFTTASSQRFDFVRINY